MAKIEKKEEIKNNENAENKDIFERKKLSALSSRDNILINNDMKYFKNELLKELKNIKQENLNNSSFSEEFDNNNINLEKPYKANHKKIFLPLSDQVLNFISFFCLFSFFILYIFDLFAYGFAFYKDSNSVPFS